MDISAEAGKQLRFTSWDEYKNPISDHRECFTTLQVKNDREYKTGREIWSVIWVIGRGKKEEWGVGNLGIVQ